MHSGATVGAALVPHQTFAIGIQIATVQFGTQGISRRWAEAPADVRNRPSRQGFSWIVLDLTRSVREMPAIRNET